MRSSTRPTTTTCCRSRRTRCPRPRPNCRSRSGSFFHSSRRSPVTCSTSGSAADTLLSSTSDAEPAHQPDWRRRHLGARLLGKYRRGIESDRAADASLAAYDNALVSHARCASDYLNIRTRRAAHPGGAGQPDAEGEPAHLPAQVQTARRAARRRAGDRACADARSPAPLRARPLPGVLLGSPRRTLTRRSARATVPTAPGQVATGAQAAASPPRRAAGRSHRRGAVRRHRRGQANPTPRLCRLGWSAISLGDNSLFGFETRAHRGLFVLPIFDYGRSSWNSIRVQDAVFEARRC